MRPPRFLADADFNQKIVVGLRRREPSVDFLNALDGGVIGLPDPAVISVAAQSGWILVSHDRKTMPGHFARFRETRCGKMAIVCPSKSAPEMAQLTRRKRLCGRDASQIISNEGCQTCGCSCFLTVSSGTS